MEEFLIEQLESMHDLALLGIVAVTLMVLGKAADLVVDYAVVLSERSGIPKVIIGATVISLGTTAPEVAVSVLAALQGNSGLALGNAVGSIICDTGLILGIACLIRPLTIPYEIANRQGWVQLLSGALLVLFSIPWDAPLSPFTETADGVFSQWAGFLFLLLLAAYLWLSVKWTRRSHSGDPAATESEEPSTPAEDEAPPLLTLIKLFLAVGVVVLSAHVLIPAVTILAQRWGVPQSILAATLVAFGTSLPELVTAVQASRRGHGDLAVGNIIGADVLNALFVAGASAAVTKDGLIADNHFFKLQFPAMLIVLVVFRLGIFFSKGTMKRGFGFILIGTYLVYLGLNIAFNN